MWSRSPSFPPADALSRQSPYPFQSAVELELLAGDIAEHRSIWAPRGFGFRSILAQIHGFAVILEEVLQCFGEQFPGGHVRCRERKPEERDLASRLQGGERVRPGKRKYLLLDEAGFSYSRRDHYRFRFKVAADLLISELNARPVEMARDAVYRSRFRIARFRLPVDGSVAHQQSENLEVFRFAETGDRVLR